MSFSLHNVECWDIMEVGFRDRYGGTIMEKKNNMKRSLVANFNLVFYEKNGREEPLLRYFDTIVMPAFTSKYIKESGDSRYFFTHVGLEQSEDGEYVLKGILIKKTFLEIKSDVDENWDVIEKDERYSAAPFSTFVIYLKNHRMLFVQNQKGSPSIKNFAATSKAFLNRYVRENNKKLKENGEVELPIPILNVVGIPIRKKLVESLAEVEKINELCLRFYPLNGDIDFGGILGDISNTVRKAVGSKKSDLVLKSPQNIDEVIDLVEKSNGIVEPIFKVTYIDEHGKKRQSKIQNEKISESMELNIQSGNLEDEVEQIMKEGKKLQSITYISKNNDMIYNANSDKIIKLIEKK